MLPDMRELTETANSGALVPKATIVRPINSLDTLKFVAAEEAPSTRRSAPLIKNTKPMMSRIDCRIMSIYLFYLACA